jgi:hypothetical protein
MSPREISKILKKANGEKDEKERKKIVLSNTTRALQLFKRGKSPTEVAIKLDLSPQEAQSLYIDYLSLNNLHHFVEAFKEFDNESLQDFINLFHLIEDEGIDKKETVEASKMINDYPRIKEEYYEISAQLNDLLEQKEFYASDHKMLIRKNCELTNEHDSLVLKIKSANRMLQLAEIELNKKREILGTIDNSEEYTKLKKIKLKNRLMTF